MGLFTPSSVLEFAPRVVLPSGPAAATRLDLSRNPIMRHMLSMYDVWFNSDTQRELYMLAGNQIGKSLSGLIMTLYCVLEQREDVVIFGPSIQIASAVLSECARSLRYMNVNFNHTSQHYIETDFGVKIWARGQSDAQRAQATGRFVWVTEAEKIKRKNSDESDPIDQIRARVLAYPRGKLLFESTLAGRNGLMWSAYNSSAYTLYEFEQRCTHCSELFTPDINTLSADGYACGRCGSLITHAERYDCVSNGQFTLRRKAVVGDAGIVMRCTSFDSVLVPENVAIMLDLRDSKDIDKRRRLQLQFLAQPPCEIYETPPDPTHLSERLRGRVEPDEFWALGLDYRHNGLNFCALAYNPHAPDYVIITDFGLIKGEPDKLAQKVEYYRQTHYSNNTGLIVFDFGYKGSTLVYRFSEFVKHGTYLPCRGIDDQRYTLTNIDVQHGDYWRLRTMRWNMPVPCLQFASTAIKDKAAAFLWAKRVRLFRAEDLKNNEELRIFCDSLCRSEVPNEDKRGIRRWVSVRQHNHFFDAFCYALVALNYISNNVFRLDADYTPEEPHIRSITADIPVVPTVVPYDNDSDMLDPISKQQRKKIVKKRFSGQQNI